MRRTERRDDNEKPIFDALERIGASVHRLDAGPKGGIPDLLVGWCGKMFLLEVKRDDGRGKLTVRQLEFRRTWKGPMPAIVYSHWDALRALGAIGDKNLRDHAYSDHDGDGPCASCGPIGWRPSDG